MYVFYIPTCPFMTQTLHASVQHCITLLSVNWDGRYRTCFAPYLIGKLRRLPFGVSLAGLFPLDQLSCQVRIQVALTTLSGDILLELLQITFEPQAIWPHRKFISIILKHAYDVPTSVILMCNLSHPI